MIKLLLNLVKPPANYDVNRILEQFDKDMEYSMAETIVSILLEAKK